MENAAGGDSSAASNNGIGGKSSSRSYASAFDLAPVAACRFYYGDSQSYRDESRPLESEPVTGRPKYVSSAHKQENKTEDSFINLMHEG